MAATGHEAADRLLNTDPLALLLGMLLDQQIPLEWAFMGPYRLTERLGAGLEAHHIAERDPDSFAELVRAKPALHRFPSSMAKRMQELCRHIAEHYDGDARAVWAGAGTGEELFRRLRDLPGYGDEKARTGQSQAGAAPVPVVDGQADAGARRHIAETMTATPVQCGPAPEPARSCSADCATCPATETRRRGS